MRVTIDHAIYTFEREGEEVETVYEIELDLTPYDPGRTYGPPEKCYPPEGGDVEILSVKFNGVEVPVEKWLSLGIDDREEEKIAEATREHAAAMAEPDEPERD